MSLYAQMETMLRQHLRDLLDLVGRPRSQSSLSAMEEAKFFETDDEAVRCNFHRDLPVVKLFSNGRFKFPAKCLNVDST